MINNFSTNNLTLIRSIKDPCLGDIKLYKDNYDNIILAKSYLLSNAYEKDMMLSKLQQRRKIVHKNLIPILDIRVNIHYNFCSSYYEIVLYYPYYEKSFGHLMYEGVKLKPKDLIVFLYTMIELLSMLQDNGVSHNNIDPWLIKIDKNQTILLMDSLDDQINFDKLYQSPEKFRRSLGITKNLDTYNPFKCDAFSLSLVLLELAGASNIQSIYDLNSGVINKNKLEKIKAQLTQTSNNIPQIYFSAITKLSEFEITKRYDFINLKKCLPSEIDIEVYFNINDEPLTTGNNKVLKSRYNQRFNTIKTYNKNQSNYICNPNYTDSDYTMNSNRNSYKLDKRFSTISNGLRKSEMLFSKEDFKLSTIEDNPEPRNYKKYIFNKNNIPNKELLLSRADNSFFNYSSNIY